MSSAWQPITIHAQAPSKPSLGEPCNGCGVCCAAEPCPVSYALLWPHQAPCKALEWHQKDARYYCGMVKHPARYLRWLPARANTVASKLFKRWIAAGTHCDAEVDIEHS